MALRRILLAVAGAAAFFVSTVAFAQTTPPTAPTYRSKDGQVHQGDGVGTFCSADAGLTWLPCAGASGGGGASESHIGEVGGNQITVQVAQTVTASSAYTSGNAIGGLITVANAARVSAGSGILQSVVVNSKSAQTSQIDIFIFSANPSGSTCTDKTAFSLAAADFDKVLGVVTVTAWFSAGTPSVGQAQNLAMPYALASGTSVYACAVTRATPTYTATSDISVGFRFMRN